MGKVTLFLITFCIFGFIAACSAQDFNIPNIDLEALKNIKLPEGHELEGHDHEGHDHGEEEGAAAPAPAPRKRRVGPSGVNYVPPKLTGSAVFFEPFDDSWTSRWTVIQSERYNGNTTL